MKKKIHLKIVLYLTVIESLKNKWSKKKYKQNSSSSGGFEGIGKRKQPKKKMLKHWYRVVSRSCNVIMIRIRHFFSFFFFSFLLIYLLFSLFAFMNDVCEEKAKSHMHLFTDIFRCMYIYFTGHRHIWNWFSCMYIWSCDGIQIWYCCCYYYAFWWKEM